MSAKRTSLEIIAPSVEEAVQRGLDELNVPRDLVELEILDEGAKGLFGLGARQARIRLTLMAVTVEKKASSKTSRPRPVQKPVAVEAEPVDVQPSNVTVETAEDEVLENAERVVLRLLEGMKIRAQVQAHYGEDLEMHGKIPVKIDVQGSDLSILIGYQAETLNSLQYIAGMILGKELGRSIPLVIDIQGYRQRREQQLRHLAHRMADQAIKTGRRQILEPMPANERRIVHLELRDSPEVTTESVGVEPRRKVTILPK